MCKYHGSQRYTLKKMIEKAEGGRKRSTGRVRQRGSNISDNDVSDFELLRTEPQNADQKG